METGATTREVERTSHGTATLQRILVVADSRGVLDDAGICLGRPWATEILDRFPNGTFSNSEYNVKGINPDTYTKFREEDTFRVTDVRYEGSEYSDEYLSFHEYVELGRPEKISIRGNKKISAA